MEKSNPVRENWRLRQNLALSYRLFDDLSLNEVTIIPDDVSLISLTTSSLLFSVDILSEWPWLSSSLCLSFPLFCPGSDIKWFTKLDPLFKQRLFLQSFKLGLSSPAPTKGFLFDTMSKKIETRNSYMRFSSLSSKITKIIIWLSRIFPSLMFRARVTTCQWWPPAPAALTTTPWCWSPPGISRWVTIRKNIIQCWRVNACWCECCMKM